MVSRHPRAGRDPPLASEAKSVGVTYDWSDRGIPTKPVGGLLSDIGIGDPCLQLAGQAIPDCPEIVLTSLPGSSPSICKQTSSKDHYPPPYSRSRTCSQRVEEGS